MKIPPNVWQRISCLTTKNNPAIIIHGINIHRVAMTKRVVTLSLAIYILWRCVAQLQYQWLARGKCKIYIHVVIPRVKFNLLCLREPPIFTDHFTLFT